MGGHSFRNKSNSGRSQKHRLFGRSNRLRLELLEDRRLLSIGYDAVDPSWFAMVETADTSEFVGPLPLEFSTFGTVEAESSNWIVRLTPEATASAGSVGETSALLQNDSVDLKVVKGLGLPGMLLIESTSDVASIQQALKSNPLVASFEPDRIVTGQAAPNDESFADMWNLDNQGQFGGTADVDIDASEAWDLTTGSRSVVVGVIDSGIDPTHEDLYLNVWINQGEIPDVLKLVLTDVDADGLFTFFDLNDPLNSDHVTDHPDDGNDYIDAQDLLVDSRWADGLNTDGNGLPFVDDLFGWDFENGDHAQ